MFKKIVLSYLIINLGFMIYSGLEDPRSKRNILLGDKASIFHKKFFAVRADGSYGPLFFLRSADKKFKRVSCLDFYKSIFIPSSALTIYKGRYFVFGNHVSLSEYNFAGEASSKQAFERILQLKSCQ